MKIGICYRPNIHKEYLDKIIKEIDIIEIMPDIMDINELEYLLEKIKFKNIDISIHCLKSSIASPYGISEEDIEKYYYISRYVNTVYFSDHLAYSHIENIYLSSVFPIEYSDKNEKIVKRNIEKIKIIFKDIQFLLENITQYNLINPKLSEGEFFKKLDENILLDITNLYITAISNNLNPQEYLDEFPLDKVKTIHISGLDYNKKGNLVDNHKQNLSEEILSFLKDNLKKLKNVEHILVERDFNTEMKEENIISDIEKINKII